MFATESKKNAVSHWINRHLMFPFIPVIVEIFVKVILNKYLNWISLNVSTCALIVSFACLSVIDSLNNSDFPTNYTEEIDGTKHTLNDLMIVLFGLFLTLIVLEEIPSIYDFFRNILIVFKIETCTLCVISIHYIRKARQNFQLN
jgi:hypothetical protein